MKSILLVSKPLEPPWNDSSKNLVRDLAFGLERYAPVGFGRSGGATTLGRVRLEPVHAPGRSGFAPGLREQLRVLSQLLVGPRFDVLHFFFAPNPKTSRVARAAAFARRSRSVQTVCSVPREDTELDRVLFADRVVVLSEHTERRFRAAGIDAARLVRIPPSVPALVPPAESERRALRLEFGVSPGAPLLVYPGDLEFGQGAALTVEAHARLARDTELVLACRTKTERARLVERELRERAARLGTAARVRFAGETPRIHALLAAADVVALPSEVAYAKMDYPLVLLEAMALARPVLVCSGTPAAELATAGAAIAVAPAVDAVLAELERLFADEALRTALGDRARARVLADHDRTRMARAYEALYDALP